MVTEVISTQAIEEPAYLDLLNALMEMVHQHCSYVDGDTLHDAGLSSNEIAFAILIQAGVARRLKGGGYKLIWEVVEQSQ
jgi:hypothetical protein